MESSGWCAEKKEASILLYRPYIVEVKIDCLFWRVTVCAADGGTATGSRMRLSEGFLRILFSHWMAVSQRSCQFETFP